MYILMFLLGFTAGVFIEYKFMVVELVKAIFFKDQK